MSIKSQIITRILALLEPLISQGVSIPGRADVVKLRKVLRKNTVFHLEQIKPALHLVVGDEQVLDEQEQGYTMTFQLALKILISEVADAELIGDELCAFIQTHIEADQQLGSLVSKITYQGDRPSLNDQGKPDGEIIVDYVVEYRRYRGDPARSY